MFLIEISVLFFFFFLPLPLLQDQHYWLADPQNAHPHNKISVNNKVCNLLWQDPPPPQHMYMQQGAKKKLNNWEEEKRKKFMVAQKALKATFWPTQASKRENLWLVLIL